MYVEGMRVGADIKPFVLYPGEFVLGHIQQTVGPKSLQYAAQFQNKSSWARIGLDGFGGSGVVDPTNVGRWTVELGNRGMEPLQIFAGVNIIQLCFDKLISPAVVGYEGKYKMPTSVEGAK
jgi:deoxycytidine triphosphate deaminase